jgi:hypothetical protein
VLFIADAATLTRPDRPILVIDPSGSAGQPYRSIPAELWAIEKNLNIASMD